MFKSCQFVIIPLFQFQNGTIKSLLLRCGKSSHWSFQFQNGTIKRRQPPPLMIILSYFNSKMVRLRERCFVSNCYRCEKFQFQNGTIKRVWHFIVCGLLFKFQFQNGTIKRLDYLMDDSTLFIFQFQNGTIKRAYSFWINLAVSHFNSKMVRLRDGSSIYRSQTFSEFQFQNGTIKSVKSS